MEQGFTDISEAVNREFEKLKELFRQRLASGEVNAESYFETHLQRLKNNRNGEASLKDFNSNAGNSFLNGIGRLAGIKKFHYSKGWAFAENGKLNSVPKAVIEDWPDTIKEGAADALFYHWLMNERSNLNKVETIRNNQTKKEPKLHSVALCYYYLHWAGKYNNLKEDIKERYAIADHYNFSKETFYKAYMTYIRDGEAMNKGGNNQKTIEAKIKSLKGAIALLKTKPESEKAVEKAISDLKKLNEKLTA